MERRIHPNAILAWVGFVLLIGSGAFASGDEPKEIMWLVDGARYKPIALCGNSSEFDWPGQYGIIINEDGEIIERAPGKVWPRQLTDELVLLSSIQENRDIPKRRLIRNDRRVKYESDLAAWTIGNGWLMCADRGRFGMGGGATRTKLADGTVTKELKYFYFDDQLERVDDIRSSLGIDLRGQKLIGFIEPSGIPVVEEPGTKLQRIIKDDGSFSKNAFYQIDFERRFIKHPVLVNAQAIPQRWLYDPIDDKKVLAFRWTMSTNALSEVLVLNTGEGELAGVYDARLNRIAELGFRIQPAFVTSEDILVCVDRVQTDVVQHRVFKAYQVILEPDESTADRLIEIDASWIKEIELRQIDGPLYAVRNQADELVILDAMLEPAMTLGPSYDIRRITKSGHVLVVDRETHVYSLYGSDGELIRDFDVAALLDE